MGVCLIFLIFFFGAWSKFTLQGKMRVSPPPGCVRTLKISNPPSSHSRLNLTRQTMVLCFCYESLLFLKLTSHERIFKNKRDCGIGGGGGGDGVEFCSIER